MPRAKATDEISDQAREILARGCAAGWTAARIAQAVMDATGEKLAPRTVARRAAEWRESKRRFDAGTERMKQLLQAADEMGTDPSAFIRALALDHLRENPNAFDEADPVQMGRMSLAAEELQLKRRAVAVKERGIAAIERKLEMAEAKEERLREVEGAARRGEISQEERAAKVDEILGLRGTEASA